MITSRALWLLSQVVASPVQCVARALILRVMQRLMWRPDILIQEDFCAMNVVLCPRPGILLGSIELVNILRNKRWTQSCSDFFLEPNQLHFFSPAHKNGVFAGEFGNHLQADPESYITELRTEEGNLARLTYACAECGKTAKSRGDLKKHVLSKHIQGPPVTCPYCSRTYKNSPSLQAHISQSHRDGSRSHSFS